MRCLFVGKITDCPGVEYIGRFGYHFADCDEDMLPDLATQEITNLLYGIKDIQTLRQKVGNLEHVALFNGIPEKLFRKFTPDSQYKMDKLSDAEFASLKSKQEKVA